MGFTSAPRCDYCRSGAGLSVMKGSTVRHERFEGSGTPVLVTDHVLTEAERTALYDEPLFMRQVHRLCKQCRQALCDFSTALREPPT